MIRDPSSFPAKIKWNKVFLHINKTVFKHTNEAQVAGLEAPIVVIMTTFRNETNLPTKIPEDMHPTHEE